MRAAWQTMWSTIGYMKPSNCASATGFMPCDGQADGEAGDGGFVQRRVEDALGAEALLQAGGGAEHAAVDADVLAQHHDGVVVRIS